MGYLSKNPSKNAEMRLEQARRCLESELSVYEWCELNKVGKSTMYTWMKRLKEMDPSLKKDDDSNWVELTRLSVKNETALAPMDAGSANVNLASASEVPNVQANTQASSSIRVMARGLCVEVPPSTLQEDISCVLKAVMSL